MGWLLSALRSLFTWFGPIIVVSGVKYINKQQAKAQKAKEEKEAKEAAIKKEVEEKLQAHKEALAAKEGKSEQAQKDFYDDLFSKP